MSALPRFNPGEKVVLAEELGFIGELSRYQALHPDAVYEIAKVSGTWVSVWTPDGTLIPRDGRPNYGAGYFRIAGECGEHRPVYTSKALMHLCGRCDAAMPEYWDVVLHRWLAGIDDGPPGARIFPDRPGAVYVARILRGAAEVVVYPLLFGGGRLLVGPTGVDYDGGANEVYDYLELEVAVHAAHSWNGNGDPPNFYRQQTPEGPKSWRYREAAPC